MYVVLLAISGQVIGDGVLKYKNGCDTNDILCNFNM